MRQIGPYLFQFVDMVVPEQGPDGHFIEYFPQDRYRNAKRLPLNRHGRGPFCCFRIRCGLPYTGVYALTVNSDIAYIGECQNLSERFGPRGYGLISPRNCFKGGQSTNCKINNLILESAKAGKQIDLWFHRTLDRKRIEAELIQRLSPPWNGL